MEKKSNWKKFAEKKPPNGVRVLVAFDISDWSVFIASYHKGTEVSEEHWTFDNAAFNLLTPTFWMPLPEVPKGRSAAE